MKKRWLTALFILIIFVFQYAGTHSALAECDYIRLPILMYHQVSQKQSKLGKYVISPAELENDMELIEEAGYTTVTVAELAAFANGTGSLPEKPVMLTFDDGFQSDYRYVFPLLKKYNMKAVFSIVGSYADKYSEPGIDKHIDYAYLSWEEISEMRDSGLAEFQSHTYNMHTNGKRRGALQKKNESVNEYRKALTADMTRNNEAFIANVGEAPAALTCPFGCFNETLRDIIKENGYTAILSSAQKVNRLTGDPDELFHLCRFVRPHGMNMEDMISDWDE